MTEHLRHVVLLQLVFVNHWLYLLWNQFSFHGNFFNFLRNFWWFMGKRSNREEFLLLRLLDLCAKTYLVKNIQVLLGIDLWVINRIFLKLLFFCGNTNPWSICKRIWLLGLDRQLLFFVVNVFGLNSSNRLNLYSWFHFLHPVPTLSLRISGRFGWIYACIFAFHCIGIFEGGHNSSLWALLTLKIISSFVHGFFKL